MICFQISIFEPLETTKTWKILTLHGLWFAFKLVSLNHWKQRWNCISRSDKVVICFQISIFEPLETTWECLVMEFNGLWFAFKLVSLNHWKQHNFTLIQANWVVICFQIIIFVIVWSTLFDYQRIIFNSHENGQRIRKCQAVQNHYIPHAFK